MSDSTVLPIPRHQQTPLVSPPTLTSVALSYARDLGFAILPLHGVSPSQACLCGRPCSSPGKHPLILNGSKGASKDLQQISVWWNNHPKANIGIATGDPSELVVLDVDAKSGGLQSLASLEKQFSSLESFTSVKTGGGGWHFYFLTGGKHFKNKVGILPGIDLRGDGGYVVAPPSLHISGNLYQWHKKTTLQQMPQWLETIVRAPSAPLNSCSSNSGIKTGGRNNFLVSLGGFLKAKGVNQGSLSSFLSVANDNLCDPPLGNAEVSKVSGSLSQYDEWQAVKPLSLDNLATQQLFETDLPEELRPWVSDVCERMQLPIEFIAVPTMIAVATLVGRKRSIRPLQNDDWEVIPNLWGLLVAEPGSMKSAGLQQAFKPLQRIEHKAQKAFQNELKDINTESRNLATKIESMKQAMKMDWQQGLAKEAETKLATVEKLSDQSNRKAKEVRYRTNDPTIEKLALILKDNPQGIMLFRDEISGWLEGIGKAGREGSREFYLEAWNGNGSFSIDRISRGTIYTESLCLSVFGGIQPEKLQKYLKKYETSFGRDGFIERFQLAIYPEPRSSFTLIDRAPSESAFTQSSEMFLKLDKIKLEKKGPTALHFSPDAQALANEWRSALENSLLDRRKTAEERSFLSKYRSLMPSLALLFHICDQPSSELSDVGIKSVNSAIRWCNVLSSHMRKMLSMGSNPKSNALRLLEGIKSGEIYSGQKTREIYRKGWAGLKNPSQVSEALKILEEHHYLKRVKEAAAGRSSEVIFLNPGLGETE